MTQTTEGGTMEGPFVEDPERDGRLKDLLRFLGRTNVPTSALKARRKAAGFTQAGLAGRSGFSQPTLHRIEAGTAELTPEGARRLDGALGRGPGDLPLEQAEMLSSLKRRALAGELSPERMEKAALLMASNEPDDERMRPAVDAAVAAMLDVAETAAKNWRPAKTRDGVGRRRQKPTDAGRV